MELEFIPYAEALVLKELGFDEPCIRGWDKNNKIWYHPDSDIILDNPTFSQAFRWFREKYSLYINLIYDWNDEVYRVTIMMQNEDKSCKVIYLKEGDYIKEYKTLEEAEIECLIRLIEIVKENK
jgi:hypothetical protein